MNLWSKISLFKFQQIDAINENKVMPDIDKALFSACVVFNMTEYEMDNAGVKEATLMLTKITEIFESPFADIPRKKIGRYFINYDISAMTFGQYIELAFFLSGKPIQNGHYILASISNVLSFEYTSWAKWRLVFKNKTKDHRKKADYFLKQPVTKVTGSLALITEQFIKFNNEYKSLFGLDKEVSGEVQNDVFNKRYGWIYSASVVAEYERIPLKQAFELPVRQAFNDLAFLKAKVKYDYEQSKKK